LLVADISHINRTRRVYSSPIIGTKKRSGKPASKKFSKPKTKLLVKRKGDAIENSNNKEVTYYSVSLALLIRN